MKAFGAGASEAGKNAAIAELKAGNPAGFSVVSQFEI